MEDPLRGGEGLVVAVVTLAGEKVLAGGAPVFVVSGSEEREKVATTLGRVLDSQVHDLGNGVYVLVKR
ncbi:MAG: hypothetical protein C4551_02240 [Bacillota bacterium]|nr:MAG: hypothetical protein C4551_02240 [Bacillota bacterium]